MSADDAARQEAEQRYRRQTMHIGTAQDREVSAFTKGAAWAREQVLAEVRAEQREGDAQIAESERDRHVAIADALAVLDRAADRIAAAIRAGGTGE